MKTGLLQLFHFNRCVLLEGKCSDNKKVALNLMTDIQCLRIKLYKADLMRILNPTACCEWIPRRKMNIEAWVKYYQESGHQFEGSSL